MTQKRYDMRPASVADIPEIVKLARTVAGADPPPLLAQQLQWKMNDNPVAEPDSPRGIVATDSSGTIIAFLLLVPFRLQLGENQEAAHWMQLMIADPRHRGIGYQAVKKMLTFELREFGFPFPRLFDWYKRSVKSAGGRVDSVTRAIDLTFPQRLGPLTVRRRPRLKAASGLISLAWMPLKHWFFGRQRRAAKALDGFRIERPDRFDDRIDRLWDRFARGRKIGLVRSGAYLNWKFLAAPGKSCRAILAVAADEVVGYIVLRTGTDRGVATGFIVDFVVDADRQDVFRGLVALACEALRTAPIDQIRATVSAEMASYQRSLRSLGFVFRSEANQLLAYSPAKHVAADTAAGISVGARWHITRADSDLDD